MLKALLVTVLLLAGPALAVDYTITVNAAEDTALANERAAHNAAVCAKMGVPSGCTQSAARNAFCVSVGLSSGCTYSAARDAWCARNSALGDAPCVGVPVVVIAGNAGEVLAAKAQAAIDALRAAQRAAQGSSMCGPGGLWRSMTRAQKNAVCAATVPAQAAGCDLCPQ